MQFVRTEDLRTGMRLARPIYNKDGVLLYERDSKLTRQGIVSIRHFGLIGLFVLEPAEPVPPMTLEDIEFERFQTVSVFAIQEELTRILQTKKAQKMQMIVASIIKSYGRLEHKINFIQSLRSKEDFIYKHVLNTAMLCAMMAKVMQVRMDEQLEVVTAAIVHDIGKLGNAKHLIDKSELTMQEELILHNALLSGFELIEEIFVSSPNIKRICMQCQKGLECIKDGTPLKDANFAKGSRILMVAETFDRMTAMQFGRSPDSPVKALHYLLEHEAQYGRQTVNALVNSIHILSPGVCVELNTGEKGLVIKENEQNVLRPVVLSFRDNEILDLEDERLFGDLDIVDVMRTLDNRYIFDKETLKKYGYYRNEPDEEGEFIEE
ncbi:MAG: phosphohydrolase [Lachnospiraceae bacterium]|nr:phosphohydrolase [Lachnospiraceae bacterium]